MDRRALMLRLAGIAIAATVLVAIAPGKAAAHVPVLEPHASSDAAFGRQTASGGVAISPPEASTAIYGTLAPGESGDAFTFTPTRSFVATMELLVPSVSALKGLHPRLALYERGQIRDEASWNGGSQAAFFEPFSLQRFRSETDLAAHRFEQGVPYTIAVTPGRGERQTGPYVIVFGGPERFTAADMRSSLGSVPRIWLGLYGQWAIRWGMVAALMGIVALFVWGVVAAVRRRRRRALATA